MFRFSTLNEETAWLYFRLPKRIVDDGLLVDLPHAAVGVLGAIGIHMNKRGQAFPAETTIAAMCGLTHKTVRAIIAKLEDIVPGFEVEHYTSAKGRRAKRYHFRRWPTAQGAYLSIYRAWLDGGNWNQLRKTPSAWALYAAMRFWGFAPDYQDAMGLDPDSVYDDETYREFYATRPFDYCAAERDVLRRSSGLHRNTLVAAESALKRAGFIAQDDEAECWRVYLRPPFTFRPDLLNEELRRRGL